MRPRDTRRTLRLMTLEGAGAQLMVGLGETYIAAFALSVGLGAVGAGLLATLPLFAGGLLQLITPLGTRWLGSNRRWAIGCALVQIASFAPLIAGAVVGRLPAWVLFAATALYWGGGMAISPAWQAWAATLVPERVRTRYFARRAWASHVALCAGVFGAGGLLWLGGSGTQAFAWVFAAAVAARLFSTAMFWAKPEPQPPVPAAPTPPRVTPPTRSARPLFGYLLSVQVFVHVAAPFFTPYMLRELALSHATFSLLLGTALVSRIAAMPLLGRWAQRHGARALLVVGGICIAPLPALWLLSDHLVWLIFIQVSSGIAWGAYELATLLLFFETLAPEQRVRRLTLYNLANVSALALGSALGAGVLSLGPDLAWGYAAVFLISTAGRALALVWLPRLKLDVHEIAPPMRTLAVRPALGAVERPVLAGLPRAPEGQVSPES